MSNNVFNVRRRKVGGVWFVRIGSDQFSFCLCRSFEPAARVYSGGNIVVVHHDH